MPHLKINHSHKHSPTSKLITHLALAYGLACALTLTGCASNTPAAVTATASSVAVNTASTSNTATTTNTVIKPTSSETQLTQPEAATGSSAKSGWATHSFAVAAANPLATEAGYQILKAGGSAVDAAIAVQMVLGLVEPQSSGIGGGAFMLYFDGKTVEALDGRETAPSRALPSLFLDPQGKPMAFADAVVGGRSVGTPGVLSMLELAHDRYGVLPWAQLFAPAIQLARDGFVVSPRLAGLLKAEKKLQLDAVAAAYFYDAQGNPWPAGHLLKNPELAEVLSRIAAHGASALMHGEIANAIVQKVHSHPSNPGTLALDDLVAYQARVRPSLCFDYTAQPNAQPSPQSLPASSPHVYRICGMPPPSSGTIAIGQMLGILASTPAAAMPLVEGTPSANWLHLYSEAARLAFADRAQYLGDPDFVAAPAGDWNSLLAPSYLQARAQRIDTSPSGKSMGSASAGNPSAQTSSYAPMANQIEYGTSHISIVDAQGHALAMTTTVEDAFGARQMVNRGVGLAGGFMLNNQLTDFSFSPTGADGKPVANAVAAGKRPRSSMSPILVFDKDTGRLVMSAGSPGGAMIIHYTAKTLYGVLNWGLNAQQAINLPNFGSLNGPTLLEEKRFNQATIDALQARGHTINQVPMPSGLQAIVKTPNGYFGGADPRREGVVRGD